MMMFPIENGRLAPKPAFVAGTLAEPNNIRARQAASTVHVHPNGRFVYGANRAEQTEDYQGQKVFKGGENGIVVFAIDPATGEPKRIQNIETQRHPPAHVPHRPERPDAGRASTICRSRCATATRSRPSWPGCRCCGSATTASSNSSASTTSMSATRRCAGWGWCRCRRSAAVAEGARGGLTSPGAGATRLARCR